MLTNTRFYDRIMEMKLWRDVMVWYLRYIKAWLVGFKSNEVYPLVYLRSVRSFKLLPQFTQCRNGKPPVLSWLIFEFDWEWQ